MPSKNNNSNWKKKSGSETIYESTLSLNKYDDPDNPIDKRKGTVISRFNVITGDIELIEKTTTGVGQGKATQETLLSTIKSDGSQTFHSGNAYATYFDADNSNNRGQQLDQVLDQTKNQVVTTAKEELSPEDYEVLKNSKQYKSVGNDSESDPDTVPTAIPPESDPNNQSNKAYERKAIPEGKTLLRYPITVPNLGYDFIRITAYEYVAGGRQALKLGEKDSAKKRLIKDSNKKETVILPMQPNFSESNAVNWGGDNLNPLQMMGAGFATGAIKAIGNLGSTEGGFQKSRDIVKGTFESLGEDVSAILNDETSGPALVAYFAGQAVGANILGRSAGVTLNPNLELLFKGPNLRTFSFNFRFTPRSAEESREIKEIIRVFKKNMAVQRSTSNLFLLTPRVFTLEYIFNANGDSAGQIHPYLNVFKPMAMTNLNVNYTPDGTYMTYNQDGSMTSYDLQMSFGELEPIYADEFEDSNDDAIGSFSDHKNMGY